ncbi:MAG: ParB/RepB/Spo0J family partition protein [Nitrospirae bacterium]|nr:ParB/RepB/Spo0J family partition protein [Nitrospirota bacterium]
MKKALGRGLDALLPAEGEEIHRIDVEKIFPNPGQPRKRFEEESLRQLASSIMEKGVIQPIVVNRNGDGTFTIVAGERRWRASTLAGVKQIPCILRDSGGNDSLEISLIENIQRENLNPIETAHAFNELITGFGLRQEDVAGKVGKDRATVANYLRLLNLPTEVKDLVSDGSLSMGHARAILSIGEPVLQLEIAKNVAAQNLSVRETENLCKRLTAEKQNRPIRKEEKDPHVASAEEDLTRSLGTKVRILHKGKRGKIEIEYYSMEELNRLIDIFKI